METVEALSRAMASGTPVALVTVIGTRGSTPRKPGARMVMDADGRIAGTVGGGSFEKRILDRADELISLGGFHRFTLHLTRELAMCCGGEMEVIVEIVSPPARLLVFGAGHIAQALCPMAAACDFEVHVFDEREEFLDPQVFPGASLHDDPLEFRHGFDLRASDIAVIMTASHDLDQEILRHLLEDGTVAYTGLIGSETKWKKFRERLSARGLPEDRLDDVVCPLGENIGAETPAEIAVSVLAGLVRWTRSRPAP